MSNEIYSSSDRTTDGWLSEVSCEGMETKLQLCSHGLWDNYDCSNEIYSAVQCGTKSIYAPFSNNIVHVVCFTSKDTLVINKKSKN